jgi:hypothetical protein
VIQLAGSFGQAMDLGLLPRLSIGTLQLSIRCSSVHFGPSRSLPVSDVGMSANEVALGVGCRVCRSCADADNAQATASSDINSGRQIAFMDFAPWNAAHRRSGCASLNRQYRNSPRHPEPARGCSRLIL